jgi:hypothetical protein
MNRKFETSRTSGIREDSPDSTGCSASKTPPSPPPQAAPARPLSLAWITDDLARYTQEVWSELYGRPITEDEAVEMLLNVKHLAEVLLKAEGMKGGA